MRERKKKGGSGRDGEMEREKQSVERDRGRKRGIVEREKWWGREKERATKREIWAERGEAEERVSRERKGEVFPGGMVGGDKPPWL